MKFILTLMIILSLSLSSVAANTTVSPLHDNAQREMRGVWIATVKNINMPAGMNEGGFRAWANENCKLLKDNNYNTVLFQIRPSGDALYNSKLNPWSTYLTNRKQGVAPDYDPLKIMIEIAHGYGLELHAWINPYRLTMADDKLEDLADNNIAKKNPDWVIKYGSQYYLDPGLPEVRAHLIETVKEIVTNYDIDGIHMDDYFYPYKIKDEVYNDSKSYNLYGKGKSLEDFRRENVNILVRDLYKSIKEIKSYIAFGISPFGIWRNEETHPEGSKTKGTQCYDDLYADSRTWINEGVVDYITPQIYWSTEHINANYSVLNNWWQEEVKTQAKTRPVNLYIGLGDYKLGVDTDIKWQEGNEIHNQININRNSPLIYGQMHYSMGSVKNNNLNYRDHIRNTHYKNKAITPSMYWLDGTIPSLPNSFTANRVNNQVKIKISSNDNNIRKYVLYRFENGKIDYKDENILDIIYKSGNTQEYIDNVENNKNYIYGIKSYSNTGVLSSGGTIAFTK